MRSSLLAVAIFAFASVSAVEAGDQPTAIMLSPIHKAQVVRATTAWTTSNTISWSSACFLNR